MALLSAMMLSQLLSAYALKATSCMKNNTQHLGQNISITILIYSTMGAWIGYKEPNTKVYFAEQSNRCLNFWAVLLKIVPLLIYYMLENNTELFLLNS